MKKPSAIFAGMILPVALFSIYVFSRFTVDDAFISWRYGKNLVDFGVWNYNPTHLDLTQAYTNPIYAALSIIPNYLGWDVVLFFKLLSSGLLIGFVYWFHRISNGSWVFILVMVGLPTTIVHVYSGLETFLFVFLTAALLVALHEEKLTKAVPLTLLLFVTRPEAWLLVVLLPVYFLIHEPRMPISEIFARPVSYVYQLRFNIRSALLSFGALGISLLGYFIFHDYVFDSFLPNTFYAKASSVFGIGDLILVLVNFVKFALFLIPIAAVVLLGRIKLAVFMLVFFGAMAVSYSTSDLQMNYAGRFAFHIFVPIYIFSVYLASRLQGRLYFSTNAVFSKGMSVGCDNVIKGGALLFLAVFAVTSASTLKSLAHLATYYPRALVSHAALGKTLNSISERYGIDSISIGDAGMVPYYSRLNSLDSYGLGSAAVARRGVTDSLLERYQLDLVALHAKPGQPSPEKQAQKKILDWAVREGFQELCDVYWLRDYTLRIYAREQIREIHALCETSERDNSASNSEMHVSAILSPPWKYWTE